jgi:hypothetical protein
MNGQATGSDAVETVATTAPSVRYLTFTPSSNSVAANSMIQTATALQYNPGSALLTTTNLTVSGTLTATVGTATNLAGGLGGGIPYQTGAGATTFLPISTVAGRLLRTTSTVPTWAVPGGHFVSFGGNASAAGNVLQFGLPVALHATTTLSSTLGALSQVYVSPYAAIVVACSAISSTSSAATVSVHINSSATALVTSAASQFTATAARTVTLLSTTEILAAGSTIEVRVNGAAIGSCQVNLYLA